MSMLGKILLFINFLGALGVFYFATQTYGKRKSVAAVVLRERLMVDGLPTDKPKDAVGAEDSTVPIHIANGDGTYTDSVRRSLVESHFKDAGGGVPLSLVEEVEKTKASVEANFLGKPDDAALRYLCGGINPQGRFDYGLLGTLAETFDERALVREWALSRGQGIPVARAAATAHINRKFEAILSPPNPSGLAGEAAELDKIKAQIEATKIDDTTLKQYQQKLALGYSFTKDDAERRKKIAHMLMLISADSANQKRVMLLCGLKTYSQALGEQTIRVEEITRRTERAFELDQAAFEDQYETLKRLAIDKDRVLLDQVRVTNGLKNQLANDQSSLAQRQTQLETVKAELAKLQTEVADLLKKQAEVERSLFQVQQKVGETLRTNFQLEADLKKTELSRAK